jgi:hypothetical protein
MKSQIKHPSVTFLLFNSSLLVGWWSESVTLLPSSLWVAQGCHEEVPFFSDQEVNGAP